MVEGDTAPAFDIYVGGGLGRTPVVGELLFQNVPVAALLPHLEGILSVYNLMGRRDNKYKARIKILLQSMGLNTFKKAVERILKQINNTFDGNELLALDLIRAQFASPSLPSRCLDAYYEAIDSDALFRQWVEQNVTPHRQAGYASVTVSLKAHGQAPGDASAEQMRRVADIAASYAFDEVRVSHQQNLVLPHVSQADLPDIHRQLLAVGLATPNVGLVSDLIACPGMDYCALATARSIPIGQAIAKRYAAQEAELGPVSIKISGCINACGHHHIGDIGILGLDRAGVENYQVTLGGRPGLDAALGEKMGPGFSEPELMLALDRLFITYLRLREASSERFADAVQRLGVGPFRDALYEVARAA